MSTEGYWFEIWQGGVCVADGRGPDAEEMCSEMVRYAQQYVADGPVTLKCSPELAPVRGSEEKQPE